MLAEGSVAELQPPPGCKTTPDWWHTGVAHNSVRKKGQENNRAVGKVCRKDVSIKHGVIGSASYVWGIAVPLRYNSEEKNAINCY